MSLGINRHTLFGFIGGILFSIFAVWMNPFLPLLIIGLLTGQRVF